MNPGALENAAASHKTGGAATSSHAFDESQHSYL